MRIDPDHSGENRHMWKARLGHTVLGCMGRHRTKSVFSASRFLFIVYLDSLNSFWLVVI